MDAVIMYDVCYVEFSPLCIQYNSFHLQLF